MPPGASKLLNGYMLFFKVRVYNLSWHLQGILTNINVGRPSTRSLRSWRWGWWFDCSKCPCFEFWLFTFHARVFLKCHSVWIEHYTTCQIVSIKRTFQYFYTGELSPELASTNASRKKNHLSAVNDLICLNRFKTVWRVKMIEYDRNHARKHK